MHLNLLVARLKLCGRQRSSLGCSYSVQCVAKADVAKSARAALGALLLVCPTCTREEGLVSFACIHLRRRQLNTYI